MAYTGKTIELISGISLVAGLFTRLMMLPLAITMITVTFGMGHGKVFTDDQHPFLFVLLALAFFLPGRESGVWISSCFKETKLFSFLIRVLKSEIYLDKSCT
ncbi:MAG: DoxX family membrane protein [Bacteroidia bacterium]|nr:DoxX family membrane protein [Bacteroidia bacterium]